MPHEPAGVQDQSTPALEESFATLAATGVFWLTYRLEGGAVVIVMETGSGVTVTVAAALFVESAVDVAVIVTDAAEAGAV